MNRNTVKTALKLAVCTGSAALWLSGCIGTNIRAEKMTSNMEDPDEIIRETASEQMVSPDNILIRYPDYPPAVFESEDYKVSVLQGTEEEILKVYDRSVYAGERDGHLDRNRRFCEFAFSGEAAEVRIVPQKEVKTYRILSADQPLESRQEGAEIIVTLEKPQIFMIEFDGDYNSLLTVFADALEETIPDRGDSEVIYIDGYYEPEGGVLTISKPDTCLYIAPGAVLCARIRIEADRVKICGRGAVVDPWSNLLRYDIRNAPGKELIRAQGKKAKIEGIKLLDARNDAIGAASSAKGLSVSGVKVLSSQSGSGGAALSGNQEAEIRGSFFYCGDRAVLTEGDVKGSVVENCTIGSFGTALQIQRRLYGDPEFKNLYIFRADGGILNSDAVLKSTDSEASAFVISGLNAADCRNLPENHTEPPLFVKKEEAEPESEQEILPAEVNYYNTRKAGRFKESDDSQNNEEIYGENFLRERKAPYASIWSEGNRDLAELFCSYGSGGISYRFLAWENEKGKGKMRTSLGLSSGQLENAEKLRLMFQAETAVETAVSAKLCFYTKDGKEEMEKILYLKKTEPYYDVFWNRTEVNKIKEIYRKNPAVQTDLEISPCETAYCDILFRNFQLKAEEKQEK